MRVTAIALVGLLLAAAAPAATIGAPAAQKWTNVAGQTITATQVGLNTGAGTLDLKMDNGKVYTLSLGVLVKDDLTRALAWRPKRNLKVFDLALNGYWEQDSPGAFEPAMQMLNKPAPSLALANWHGKAVKPADWAGHIVLIDFWATWCGPCLAQIPHTNAMVKKYAAQGVLVIGACCVEGSETMGKTAVDNSMAYPSGVLNSADTSAWHIAFWPTYAIVDRYGTLRAIGLEPSYVEQVLDQLLIEQPVPKAK